jgi:hypothetical protein
VEGLAWWVKDQPLSVPVITTGPASLGTAAGSLGAAGTTAIRSDLDYGLAAGLRISAGAWFDSDHTIGIDGSVFFLEQQSAGFGSLDPSGRGNFVINEPLAGAAFATQVSSPGLYTGGAWVDSTSRLAGVDVNALVNLHRGNGLSLDVLGGFRFLDLHETLTIGNSSVLLVTTTYSDAAGNPLVIAPPGSSAGVNDFFGTRNQFYGGQLGTRLLYQLGRWSFGGIGKLAIGATHEVITANGGTLVAPVNGPVVPLSGGNFVGGTNAGRYWSDRFALVPEAQLTVGYQLGAHVRAVVGYDFLYWSSVARPGNQVDNVYDGVSRPAVRLASSSFWAQGLTFQLQINY